VDPHAAVAELRGARGWTQQEAAERQHINAHKLENVGAALKSDIAAIKTQLDDLEKK